MPSAIKRRKVTTTTSKDAATMRTRKLNSFATISKASTIVSKSIVEKNAQVDSLAVSQLDTPSTNPKKRKLDIEQEVEEEQLTSSKVSSTRRENIKLSSRQSVQSSQFPQTPRKPISTSTPALIDTPTKGASTLLDRLLLTPKRPSGLSTSFNSSSSGITASTPKKPHKHLVEESKQLPTELLDLINLHAAFLTALTLHCAHNGSNAPADLQVLCPDIARAWGKRKVLLEDVRRGLGVLNASISSSPKSKRLARISISDYGNGKICVEIEAGSRKGNNLRPIDEDVLNGIYSQGLLARWESRDTDQSVEEFVEGLPLEEIMPCSSLLKMSGVLSKGQRRLEDMKAGIAIKKAVKTDKSSTTTITTTTTTEISTSTTKKPTLLERLRAKQLRQSLLPQAPSKTQLERRAALHRMEDVVAVLNILSTSGSAGQQRVSFTLPTLIGKLKDSFQNPISKDEGTTCVKLLAEEIAPEWVQVVRMGRVEAAVFDREKRLGEGEIRVRIERIKRFG